MNGTHSTPEQGGNRLLAWALAVSVLANLAMAAALWRGPEQPPRETALPRATIRPMNPLWQTPRSPSQAKADLSRFAGIWARFESPDHGALIQNLRAAGCPEPAIRNIVIPRIDADFEKRKEEELPKPEFWRTASQFAGLKRRIIPLLAALEVQKHRTIESFWPGEGCRRWQSPATHLSWRLMELGRVRSLGFRLASLSPEPDWDQARSIATAYIVLVEQAHALQESESGFIRVLVDFSMTLRETPKPEGGFVLAEDLDQMREDLERFNRTLPAGFSAELAARMQKPHLDGVNLSEQELHELCRLRSLESPDDAGLFYDAVPILKLAAQKEAKTSAELVDALIRELLGPERYAAYRRAQDPDFQTMLWALSQDGILPVETTATAYDQVKSARLALAALSSDPDLTPEQKAAAMSELKESTIKKLKSIVGETGYQNISGMGMLKPINQADGLAEKAKH